MSAQGKTEGSQAQASPVEREARLQGSVRATWSLELTCHCPVCDKYVDLLCAADFWDGKSHIRACEHGTPSTTDMEVDCPKCGAEFTVTCDY